MIHIKNNMQFVKINLEENLAQKGNNIVLDRGDSDKHAYFCTDKYISHIKKQKPLWY